MCLVAAVSLQNKKLLSTLILKYVLILSNLYVAGFHFLRKF
jgi:hypothetical protein